jgi:hypothetical protein
MDYCSHEEIAYSKIFNIRISDNELQLYEQCLYYVLNNCDDEGIQSATICMSKNELVCFWREVAELVWKHLIQIDPIDELDIKYIKRLETALDTIKNDDDFDL